MPELRATECPEEITACFLQSQANSGFATLEERIRVTQLSLFVRNILPFVIYAAILVRIARAQNTAVEKQDCSR